jgi:hypothetical protein
MKSNGIARRHNPATFLPPALLHFKPTTSHRGLLLIASKIEGDDDGD